ncbi:hypothetical protein BaRGS_00017657 [Batillaria attramentaria]|uniref:Uncharacterized protein n=1 Tax=Batillaria attramentaria TaxID=370345 RepID=A0ABD0KUZ4_9CAEN
MYPVTWPGYVIGSVTAVCGVLIIGFTIPALVNNFILYYQHVQFAIQKEKLRKQLGEGEKEGDVEKDTPKRAEKREKGDQAENIPLVRMN